MHDKKYLKMHKKLTGVFPATGISQLQDQLDKVVLHYTIQTELAWQVRFQLTLQLKCNFYQKYVYSFTNLRFDFRCYFKF